jgi:hypothetical protein
VAPAELLRALNAELPEGLSVHACSEDIEDPLVSCTFRISFNKNVAETVKAALNRIDYNRVLILSSPKGKLKKIPLKDILIDIRVAGPGSLDMTLGCEQGKTVRPAEVLKQGLGLSADALSIAGIRKLKKPAEVQRN